MKIILSLFIINTAFAQVKMNPQIGLNGLLLYNNTTETAEKGEDGFSLQEAEILLTSDVDHLFRAQIVLALHPAHEEDEVSPGPHSHESHGFEADLEETFIESLSLPVVTIRAGKFFSLFGKNNQLHTHALPFIKQALLISTAFGEEAFNDTGLRVSANFPHVPWFSEIHLEIMNGNNEDLFEESGHNNAYVARFNNLWDLSDSTTLELGLSNLTYSGEATDKADVLGADLTFKWRPTKKSRYTSLEWSTEYLDKETVIAGTANDLDGFMSHIRYQFSQKWWIQYRYEYLGINRDPGTAATDVHAALLAYVPSEFSAIRLQYDQTRDRSQDDPEHRVMLQCNFSIGAHPAHSY